MSLAALIEAVSGANGAKPAAIKSALMNVGQLASLGKYSRAKVVFPAPLGPAIMMIFLVLVVVIELCAKPFNYPKLFYVRHSRESGNPF